MARSKRSRKLSGTQFADSFILSKGRSVIKDFDAGDGDFIGVPANSKFKLLKRKDGVLIKGKGFRTKVRGVTVAEVEDSLEVLETASGWDQYKDPGVIVEIAPGRLIFSGKGDVFAPSDYYKDWTVIDITGEVSFPGEGMVLDGGNTAVSILQYKKLGDIKIDGGGGKDVIHLGPPEFSATSEGSIEPKNIEILRLDNGSQRWSIDGEHPDMSVEIYDGGIEITGDTRLNKISVMLNDELMKSFKKADPEDVPDGVDPDDIDSNHKLKAFVVAKKGKGGNIVDFNEVFTSETERLAVDATKLNSAANNLYVGLGLLQGDFENLVWDDLYIEDEDLTFPLSGETSVGNLPSSRFIQVSNDGNGIQLATNFIGINKDNPLSSDLLEEFNDNSSLLFDKVYFQSIPFIV